MDQRKNKRILLGLGRNDLGKKRKEKEEEKWIRIRLTIWTFYYFIYLIYYFIIIETFWKAFIDKLMKNKWDLIPKYLTYHIYFYQFFKLLKKFISNVAWLSTDHFVVFLNAHVIKWFLSIFKKKSLHFSEL